VSFIYRREIPIIFGLIVSSTILMHYFTVNPAIEILSVNFQLWGVIIASYALLLGLLSYTIYHGKQVMKSRSFYSIWALIVCFVTLIVGLVVSPSSPKYLFLTVSVLKPLSMAVSSYIGFFICSAAFRAFKARNMDAAILLVSATIIMLKNIPIGNIILPGILPFGEWFNNVVALGGNRGLIIVMGVGMIVAGIRQLLGYERGGLE